MIDFCAIDFETATHERHSACEMGICVVENGEIVSPIKDMRFDETFYHFFGEKLEDLDECSQLIPQVFSYWERKLGGSFVPGILVKDFPFTL